MYNLARSHPRATLVFAVGLLLVVILAGVEVFLRVFWGLGDPVLYRSSPLFGYRLQPNQLVHRIGGAEIRVNNLALRADRDWAGNVENKILFLGNSVTYGGSYVSTEELFSHLAVRDLDGFVAGNAGVNGWGIENMHALVVDYDFLPAKVYVTVLQEMDFYRGLSKLAGKPFWSTKPVLALQEILNFFYFNQLMKMYAGHEDFVSPLENTGAVRRSAIRLREMNEFLKSKGFIHLMYLSTNRSQLVEGGAVDQLVLSELNAQGIEITQIKDEPEITSMSRNERDKLFYDWSHLSKDGHVVWAKIIQRDLHRVLGTTRAAIR